MKFVPNVVSQKLGRQVLIAQKNSPKILFAVGIAGVVTSTVLACRATLKLDSKLTDFRKDVDLLKEKEKKINATDYTSHDHNRAVIGVYSRNSFEIAKLYAPSVIIGAVSIGALTTSHVTLNRRNASLTAAYSAMQASYGAYRERVKKELGESKELDIYHAVSKHETEIDGKLKTIKAADPNKWSPYARFFDETCPDWTKVPEQNKLFVQCQQKYLNDLLHARGHVFLNEAYDALGMPHSKAGAVVGWVIGNGDNFIDFGIFDAYNAAFVNGFERTILLDFNVDGVIYDLI